MTSTRTFVLPFISRRFTPPSPTSPLAFIPFCPSPCFLPPTATVCSSTHLPFFFQSLSPFPLSLSLFVLASFTQKLRASVERGGMQRNHSRDDARVYIRYIDLTNVFSFIGYSGFWLGKGIYGWRDRRRRGGSGSMVVALSRKRN